ncbi:LPXTG cell wall anchor domain-containing protein [Agromyces aerolatus]|uniref:LPXTG cell wall anchor domain-containing protein n=1 Tax=Agromyces sp. LY-1074 TaxID=3074080 RepID=UPI00285544CA|nr:MULTISPECIES: LPXTG cell wall anchor domain-containing protein [unclassified Agromyces]MDR5701213.1 LPXTG cell wall anchor domain-containing protein [Agromyces sp. LY-1074]MDR5706911.1 LPXTG cell wall anchor domain-containing protein [Agromyces sp. LY-1358]
MAHSASRRRLGALVAAGALTLGGLVAASPAAAEPIEPYEGVIELSKTSFPAGDWEDGFTVTGYGFDPTIPTAEFGIGSMGENGGGGIYSTEIDVAEDGTIEAHIVPDAATQAPDADGYPVYAASVTQRAAEGGVDRWVYSNSVDITITEGASVAIAGDVTPEALAAGVSAQFAGFGAEEEVEYGFGLLRYTEETELIDESYGTAVADANGAGTVSAALAGAEVGDTLAVFVDGLESGRIAEFYVQVVAPAPAPEPTPVDPAPAPAAPAGDVNRLPDTGVDLGIGLSALALLVLGAGAILVTRRTRATQR